MKVFHTSIPNNQTSYKSKIKLVSQEEFTELVKDLNKKKHYVGYPWTADTKKTGKDLYTTKIMDCICIGIVDRKKVSLFHICTYRHRQAVEKHQKGFDIENIKRRILDSINLKNQNIHAFIFGGFHFDNSKYNKKQLEKIKNIFKENLIPYSIIGGHKDTLYFGKSSIFYKNNEDTFYITNMIINDKRIDCYKATIDKNDMVSYPVYKQISIDGNRVGIKHERKDMYTSKLDFLKNRYNEVEFCKFDEFV